jgi:methanogenesis marker radical SAM protein
MMTDDISRITISGGGDPSCYPEFNDLIELLSGMDVPLHIGYTSGKGFDDPKIADFLIDHGLSELSFTVFSVDPKKRARYMHDPTPGVSLKILERLCGEIDVYGAAVVLPGVNDGKYLEDTCDWLEEKGAKGLILMRFANTTRQGLILGNAPVLKGHRVQSVEEFREMVIDLSQRHRMKISGTPLMDPSIGSPFAIRNETDLDLLLKTASAAKKVIVALNVSNPMVFKEFESKVDAILVGFGGDRSSWLPEKAFLEIIAGQTEPSGLLPFQMPADMETVEAQFEDVPRDMKCHIDSDGNTYDFAFGLNWTGVIKDGRTAKYNVSPVVGRLPE